MESYIETGKSMFQTTEKSMIAFYVTTTIHQMWDIPEYTTCWNW
jgi:hypothetical protein